MFVLVVPELQEAAVRLNIHTKKVRRENARLRGELDQLVAECKVFFLAEIC